MMVRFLIFLSASVLPAVWGQGQEMNPACDKFLDGCLNSTDAITQKNVNSFDFTTACKAMKGNTDCYTLAANVTDCSKSRVYINYLQALNDQNLARYCPSGTADPCLIGLRNCAVTYNNRILTTSDQTQLCQAAEDARTCMNVLHCRPELSTMLQSFEQVISGKVSRSTCIQSDPTASPCEKSAAKCLGPLEAEVLKDEQVYNFDDLCSLRPQVAACFNKILADPSCSAAKSRIQSMQTNLTDRYYQYCGADNKPLPCMQSLQTCTNEYLQVIALSRFGTDALYTCQGQDRLVKCLAGLETDLSLCPGLSKVKAIASYQQGKAEVDKQCSTILTSCTRRPAECVVTQDLAMQTAEELAQYDKICMLSSKFRKCLDPYLTRADCSNNYLLQSERDYIANVSNLICQSRDATKAKPCLHSVQTCAASFLQTWQHMTSVSDLCSGQATYMQCLDKVTCQGAALEQKLTRARQKGLKDGCNGSGVASLSVSLASLLWAVTALKLVA